MSLKEAGEVWLRKAPFRVWILEESSSRRGGGNVGIAQRFPSWEGKPAGFSTQRHFHRPFFRRGFQVVAKPAGRIWANSLPLACCLRCAAAVSLTVAATRFRSATVSPSRK